MSAVLEIRQPDRPVLRGQMFWWEKVRKIGRGNTFTVSDLDMAGNGRRDDVYDFVKRLLSAGYVACVDEADGPSQYERKVYEVLKTPRTLPPLTRDGRPGLQGLRQQHMWNYMRMAKSFDKRELASFASTENCSISLQTSVAYIKHLKAAGYLVVVRPAKSRLPAVYRLNPSRNTGPNAPMILRSKFVYDPNVRNIPGTIKAEADI